MQSPALREGLDVKGKTHRRAVASKSLRSPRLSPNMLAPASVHLTCLALSSEFPAHFTQV